MNSKLEPHILQSNVHFLHRQSTEFRKPYTACDCWGRARSHHTYVNKPWVNVGRAQQWDMLLSWVLDISSPQIKLSTRSFHQSEFATNLGKNIRRQSTPEQSVSGDVPFHGKEHLQRQRPAKPEVIPATIGHTYLQTRMFITSSWTLLENIPQAISWSDSPHMKG